MGDHAADLILYEMSKEQKKYGINTLVSFAADGMQFETGKNEFITKFETMLAEMQGVTDEVPRVISHQDFHHYIHGLISDSGPRFKTIVEQSEAYEASKSAIKKKINDDFDELQVIVNGFEVCRDVDKFDREFDFDQWCKDNTDVESIKQMLTTLSEYERDVNKSIKPQESRGMIQVLGRKLQTRLSGRVKEEQIAVRAYLADLADKQAREVSIGLSQIRADMGKKPSTLHTYIEFVQKLDQCQKIKEQLCESKRGLEGIKTVLT